MSHLGERLSALIDGELNHTQRERVLAHLARCDPCRREAVAMRMLKRRMHALGEATAAATLTDRLLALAALAGPASRGGRTSAGRRDLASPALLPWPVRSLAGAAIALLGLAIPAAGFLAGGNQQQPGPSVTPAVEMFIVQHAITTGQVPAQDSSAQDPSTQESAPAPEATGPGPAVTAGAGAPGFAGVSRAARGHAIGRTRHAGQRLSAARCAAALGPAPGARSTGAVGRGRATVMSRLGQAAHAPRGRVVTQAPHAPYHTAVARCTLAAPAAGRLAASTSRTGLATR